MTEKRVVKFLCANCVGRAEISELIVDFSKLPKEVQEFMNNHSEVRLIDSQE